MFRSSGILRKTNIRLGTGASIVIKFASALFTFLNGVLLARLLSVEGFGIYVLALSAAMILSVPASLGLPSLATRYISKYLVDNELGAIKGLLRQSNFFVLYSTLIILAISGSLTWVCWTSLDPILGETLLYALLLVPLMGYGALRSASLRGAKLIILAELPETLVRSAIMTLSILICVISGTDLTPVFAMQLMLVSAGCGFLIGYFFQKRYFSYMLKGIVPSFANREWIRQGIPFSVNSGIQIAKTRVLTYVLAFFGGIEAVAIFEVAMRGAKLVTFTLDAVNRAIAPYISTSYERGQMDSLQRIVRKTSRLIFVSALPIVIVIVVGGAPLVQQVFGVAYDTAYIPLLVLSVGELVSALAGSAGLLLNMTGYQAIFSRSNLFALVANTVLSIPLVTYFGAIGAATIYSLVLILQNIWLVSVVRRKMNLSALAF